MSSDLSTVPARVAARSLIGGLWRDGDENLEVRDPFRGGMVGSVAVASARDLDDALTAATSAKQEMAAMPGYERAALLRRIAAEVGTRVEEIAQVMSRETGKAIKDSRVEVARSLDTLHLCAEESVRIQGEHVPMDASAMGAGKLALTLRFPRGVVAAITPFNGPISLTVHKLGAAFAAGNTVVLKPSPKAPLSVHLFTEAVLAAGVPDGALNVIHGDAVSEGLVKDPRVDFVSFTGSIPVGRLIRASVGLTGVALELGGVGPTIIAQDGDVAAAALACARNGVLLAGQSCVSVQNAIVHRSRYDEFLEATHRELAKLVFGDPLDPATDVGTLIDEAAAQRVEAMLDRAVAQGATIATGGHRTGAQIDATLLTDVTPTMEITTEEIFGPAFSAMPYDDVQRVFDYISNSPYGLQTGVYTSSIDLALRAHRSLRTGGVIINGTSRWRSDQMPYGGTKDSGIGREGPKYAIRDMTEERLLVFA